MFLRHLLVPSGLVTRQSMNPFGYNVQRFAGSVVKCVVNQETGVAELCLNRPPVNSLNYELLSDIVSAVDNVEHHQKCTGMLWTSSSKKTFCAGLDLVEITDPDPDDIRKFWTMVQEVGLRLYGSHLPMVNAINGHTIAGGMIIGLSADYNVCSTGDFLFGLNETAFGLYPPFWLQQMFIAALGQRKGEQYLKLGKLFKPEEALQLGIVDELVRPEELITIARQQINKWIQHPASMQQLTKQKLREPIIKLLKESRQQETDFKVKAFTDPHTIRNLKSHLNKVQEKKQ